MKGEQVEEVHGTHAHCLVAAAMPIVLVVVGYFALVGIIVEDARVADSHPVGVSSDVLQHLSHSLGWRSAVDHPRFLEALFSDILRYGLAEFLQPRGQHGHELGAEHHSQCLHREEEVATGSLASLQVMPHTVLVDTSARHDAVDVRMIAEVAAPRVQDSSHASLQSLTLIERAQGVPCGAEHRAVEHRLMGHAYRMEAVGHGEHRMEVLHAGHHLVLAHLHPNGALLVLALGAVAVTAAVVADVHLSALRAHLDMAAKPSGAAQGHPAEGLAYLPGDGEAGQEFRTPVTDNLPDLVSGAAHEKMWSMR